MEPIEITSPKSGSSRSARIAGHILVWSITVGGLVTIVAVTVGAVRWGFGLG